MNASRLVSVVGFAVSWAAALSATDAVASPGYAPGESINVKYSSGELDRGDGVENVYGRIRKAAGIVCDELDVHNLARRARVFALLQSLQMICTTSSNARRDARGRNSLPS